MQCCSCKNIINAGGGLEEGWKGEVVGEETGGEEKGEKVECVVKESGLSVGEDEDVPGMERPVGHSVEHLAGE